jgi:uncharacterized protein with HEPN domain
LERVGPELPWRQIRDLGNVLRHAYDKIIIEMLWLIVVRDLPPLKAVCERMLSQMH